MKNRTNVTSSFKTEINQFMFKKAVAATQVPQSPFCVYIQYKLFSVVYSDDSTKDLNTPWGKFLSFKSSGTYSK